MKNMCQRILGSIWTVRTSPAVRPRPRRTAKGGRTAQTQDNNIDQDNPGQDVSTGYDMGGRHDEKV